MYLLALMITYNTRLLPENQENSQLLREILEMEKFVFNKCSKEHFGSKKNSLVLLHSKVYKNVRAERPEIPSQVILKGEQSCLAAYRGIKSNKHKIDKPIEKKNLAIRLDKRLYSCATKESIKITTTQGRKLFKYQLYPKLVELFNKFEYCDPLVFERNGEFWINLTFRNDPEKKLKENLALGVDLGIRIPAACSDGRLIIDRKYNKEKRRLRYLKRQLKSAIHTKKSKSAKKHLKKLKNKEQNKSKNQTHLLANEILKTNANVIVLEDLTGIKKKKNKFENKRSIAQVPFYMLKEILTYKAKSQGKSVMLVRPQFTSQTDSVTGKREGERRGRRFYNKTGLIYDADLNAANNIAQKSKLPLSCSSSILDGAGRIVTLPNAGNNLVEN